MVYIGSSEGKVYAFNAVNGRFKWDYSSEAAVHCNISVDSNRLYVGNFAGVLCAECREMAACFGNSKR